MGKQINYYIEHESFLSIAVTALEHGCVIIKDCKVQNKVIQSRDVSIITNDCWRYYFHLPTVGAFSTRIIPCGSEILDGGYNATGNSIIEAGFSNIHSKKIIRSRLFVISGYYNHDEEWIPRPDCLTKVYNALVRKAKKIAPYTHLTETSTYMDDERYGEEYEYTRKEYITPYCLKLRNEEGYIV